MATTEQDPIVPLMQQMLSKSAANPRINDDLWATRQINEFIATFPSEPTDVSYADEPDLNFGRGPSLWCIPLNARESLNVILYFHGGGFVVNTPSSHRKVTGHISKAAGMKCLSVDYRMAPEHVFPAQIEDAVASYKWLMEKKGYQPRNIFSMGDSAGGGLATSVVLKLMDLGEPLPAGIVALSPWYDMLSNVPSMDRNAETDALVNRSVTQRMIATFLPEAETTNPLAHVLGADLKGLPPMWITAGTYEVLEDNATLLAEKAKEVGVDVKLHLEEGAQHCYVFAAGKSAKVDAVIEDIGGWLKDHVGK